MKQKLRSALFAALAFTATTLFGGYLDTNTWSSDGDGSWNYDSASDRLTCVLNEDCYYSTCEISVPGRGWLTFNWRIVSAANESQVLKGYGWVDKVNSSCGVRADEYGSSGWKSMRVPVRESAGGIASIEFCDWDDLNGKIQIAEISFEAAEETPVTVKFELCGGTFENGESTTMVCTNQYASLLEPVRENCTFIGWTEEEWASIYSETVSDGTALPLGQKAVTLHALWDVPAEEAIDPMGALRDDERGNWIEFGSSVSIQDVSATWMSKVRQNESGAFESVMEWAGEYVSISVENDGSDEIDLLTLYVHGCGTLDFTSVNAYLYGNNSNAELALLIDGEEVKVLSDGASSKRLDGQYDICRLAGYYAIEEGVGTGDSDYDLHQIRVVARPKDTSTSGFEFVLLPIRWTEASGKQTVTFDSRGGSAAGTKTYSIGSAYGSLPQPSRSDATFQGWFTKPDGGEQVVASEPVRPSVTNLYARWTASLSTALGGDLAFKSANNAWIGTADVSRQNDGSWSATTDNVQYGVTNVMSTTVTGRGIISFWWMRGMEPWYLTYDFLPPLSSLSLWVDGKQVAELNSAKNCLDWRHLSYAIEKVGTHKVEWRYTPGGSRDDIWDSDAIANAIVSFNENLEEMREFYKSIGAEFPISADRLYAPGAWVQDVSWTPAGEVNDFVTWARGVAEGRTWLTGELPAIETYYTKKIKSDSRDYESVLLRALTKIAQLGENANLLAVLKKFGYTPDYQNLGTFSGNLSYGSAPLSNAVVDSVAKEAIPVLESALADLNLIPDSWTGSVMLSPDVYPVDETTFVDLADVTFARAAVKGALASLAVAQSYDLSLVYAKVDSRVTAYNRKGTSPTIKEIVNDHPSFLKSVRNKTRLAEAKALLREALETTQTADKRMLARSTDELHFFEYDAEDEEEIQFAREEVAKSLEAFDATVVLTDDDFRFWNGYRLNGLNQRATLKPFFSGAVTRSLLPTQYDAKGTPTVGSLPDATFGGLLPGLTTEQIEKWQVESSLVIDENGLVTGVEASILPSDLVIPDGVTGIADFAFAGCSKLTSVTIPEAVEEIGEYAFSVCPNLKKIILMGDDDYSFEVPEGCEVVRRPTLDFVDEVEDYYAVGDYLCLEFETSSGCTLKAAGLPRGLTFSQDGDYGWIEGIPTTAAASAVTVTASSGSMSVSKKFTLNVGMMSIELAATTDSAGMKSLTGAGYYAAGKTAALKATAETGSVFAGWYWDEDGVYPCDELGVDYRTASVSFKVPSIDQWDSPICLYAKFASADEDAGELSAHVDGENFDVDGEWELDLGQEITSLTLPTVKVTGLPKGLTFDSKALMISGSPTAPGTYEVTLTLSNTSIKNKTEKFTITVPNLDSDYIHLEALGSAWDKDTAYELVAGGTLYASDDDVPCYGRCGSPLAVSADDGWTLKVTGLPSGLTYNAKLGEITGKPTKAGYYTVTFTATKRGETTQVATRTIHVFPVVLTLNVFGEDGGGVVAGMKSISGAGEYAMGAKASLKAVANAGYVFAGWYWDSDGDSPCTDLGVDYRMATVSYEMPESDVELYAKFVSAEEDASQLTAGLDGETFTVDGTVEDWYLDVVSVTMPTVKMTGLPKGLSFDSKQLLITGCPTVPGTYQVTVTLSNTSIKNKTEKFTIVVPNITSDKIYGLSDSSEADTPYEYTVGVAKESDYLVVEAEEGYTLKVSGLPAGLKFDSKTGEITGTATKAGTYTVTFTATKGKSTETTTRTFVVSALPAKVVGTFNGTLRGDCDGENRGTFTLTATDAGKITAKVVDAKGTYSFTGAWDCGSDESTYYAELETTKGDRIGLSVDLQAEWNTASLSGSFSKANDDSQCEGGAISAQKSLFADKWYLAAESDGEGGWTLTLAETAEADLTLTPKGDGTVTLAGKLGTYSVSGSTTLSFNNIADGVLKADFVPFVTVGKVKKALSVSCLLDLNRNAGASAGTARLVE